MMPRTDYTILFEYGRPITHRQFLNYTSGIWQWVISPAKDGVITVTDDRAVTGYYRDNNAQIYDIQSFSVDAQSYSRVYTFSDLFATNKSFMYTLSTTKLLVHFDNFEPPFTFSDIVYDSTVGFSMGLIGDNKPYYNNIPYDSRIKKIFNISKKKDPLFYGLLKYTTGSISLANEDGYFDDWGDRNLYSQPARIKIGGQFDLYDDFETTFTGLVENYSMSWTDFTTKLQDPRKGLTQPIATNLLTLADYPTLPESNRNKPKPIKYGLQKNSPCMCLNETAVGGNHTFLLCDSEFNQPSAVNAVYLDGVPLAGGTADYAAGTMTHAATASVTKDGVTMTVADNLDKITADFTGASITNGVDIIKDLMLNYDSKTYNSTFWDTTEVAAAQALARNTSVSVDDKKKLSDVIQQICVDLDAIFFSKDNGLYTIRIYDVNRAVSRIIKQDEWLDQPETDNDSSEFLSSVVVKYNHDLKNNTYEQYENTAYIEQVFDKYRSYKSTTIETNLTSLSDATAKSENVMQISKSIGDVVTRSIPYSVFRGSGSESPIEIMDFIQCAPKSRMKTKKGIDITPVYGIYEVIGITKNFDKWTVQLTMRYVKAV